MKWKTGDVICLDRFRRADQVVYFIIAPLKDTYMIRTATGMIYEVRKSVLEDKDFKLLGDDCGK